MADDPQAKIIIGASPVALGNRHTYLLFQHADGRQEVIRGGPDVRSEGNDAVNLVESTALGSNKFGNLRVDNAPYEPPYDAVYRQGKDGNVEPLHADKANLKDPSLIRDMGRAPDEHSERLAASLTAQSKADGLQNIAMVVMNDDRSRAYAVDSTDTSSPWRKHSSVDVAAAINQPVEASNRQLNQTNAQTQAQAQQPDQQMAQQQAQNQQGPSMGGPRTA